MAVIDFVREHCRYSMISDIERMLASHGVISTPLARRALANLPVAHLSEVLRRLSDALTYDQAEGVLQYLESEAQCRQPEL